MSKPHLHSPNVHATSDQTGSASVAQHMRNDISVSTEANFQLRLIPYSPISVLLDRRERASLSAAIHFDSLLGAGSQRN